MLLLCIASIFLSWLILHTWRMYKMSIMLKEIMYPCMPLPIIGQAYKLISLTDYIQVFNVITEKALSNKHGVCAVWLGPKLCIFVADAEVAKRVCNLPTCLDKGELSKFLIDVVGQGSIFAPVKIWRKRRKIMMPGFSLTRLNSYFLEVFVPQAESMVDSLKPMIGTGRFCIRKFINIYNMGTVYETVLGKKFEQDKKSGQQFLRSFDVSFEILAERIVKPWLQVDAVYKLLPKYEELMGHVRVIWSLISKRIAEIREEIKSKKSCGTLKENESTTFVPFLKTLIDHSGGDRGYTDLELREEILVLLIAAIDTSAVAMGFVCLLLARYPEVQEKVHHELFEVFQESSRRITTEDLFRLQYLEAVIKETLRLYPPAPLLSRQNRDTLTLRTGITLPKNADIILSTIGINQNPLYWGDDADQFKPERWLTEAKAHPAAFMSFNYGVRNCPGYKYALTSIKTVLSTMLRRYRIVPEKVENKNLRVSFKIMLNPVDGYLIQLENKYITK